MTTLTHDPWGGVDEDGTYTMNCLCGFQTKGHVSYGEAMDGWRDHIAETVDSGRDWRLRGGDENGAESDA